MTSATPALPPPSGATSNFSHPDDALARAGLICYTLYLVLASGAFWLRCFVQLKIQKKWFLEDYCLSLAYAGLVIFCVLAQIMVSKGGGIHGWDLTSQQVHDVVYWYNYSSMIYSIAACAAKIGILLFYYRLFSTKRWNSFGVVPGKPEGLLHILILFLMFVVVGFYIPVVFIKAFQCSPREKTWNKTAPGTCINLSVLLNSSGFINTITDLIILAIPIRGVWVLQRSMRRKLQILPIFFLGAMAPAIAAKGVVTRFQDSGSPDISFTLPEISLWAGAEIAIGIICACLPTFGALRPSFRRRNSHSTRQSQWYRGNTGYDSSKHGRTFHDEETGRAFSQWGYGIEVTEAITMTEELYNRPHPSVNGAGSRDRLNAGDHGEESIGPSGNVSDDANESDVRHMPQYSPYPWVNV